MGIGTIMDEDERWPPFNDNCMDCKWWFPVTPFLEDISDLQSDAEDLFGSLDNLLYSVQEAQSRIDKFIGMCYDYSDGIDVDLETRDDFEEALAGIRSDWQSIIDFAENEYF